MPRFPRRLGETHRLDPALRSGAQTRAIAERAHLPRSTPWSARWVVEWVRRYPDVQRSRQLTGQASPLRIPGAANRSKYLEILHSTVRRVQLDHRLELLGDGRFDGIGTQPY